MRCVLLALLLIVLIAVSNVAGKSTASVEHAAHIPQQYGEVIDSFEGLEDTSILIIMDAHCNYAAQKNIVALLDLYAKSTSSPLIAFEGAQGGLEVDDFSTFPLDPVRNSIIESFLKSGKISGVEYFSMLAAESDAPALVTGVEDGQLYRDNLAAYQSVTDISQPVRTCITDLLAYLEKYADERDLFGASDLYSVQRSYRAGELAFFNYCSRLIDYSMAAQIDIAKWKNIALFAESLQVKNTITPDKLEQERMQLSRRMANSDAWDGSLDSMLQVGAVDPDDYFRRMASAAKAAEVALKHYPQVASYCSYLELIARIDNRYIYIETQKLSETLSQHFFTDSNAASVYRWICRLWHLDKLLGLDVSAAEYASLADDPWNIADLIAFADTLPLDSSIDNLKTQKDCLTSALDGIHHFYRLAGQRNEAMIDNMVSELEMEGSTTAALVVGGYHIDGICELLRDKGVSYRVVSPSMEEHSHTELYHARLNNEQSLFEQRLETSISTLQAQLDDTLAIASFMARTPLASADSAQAVRVEMKSVMTTSGIRALEQAGLYNMESLKAEIEGQLMRLWATDHFPQLDSFTVYRDLTGDLVVELSVYGTIYTFYDSSTPVIPSDDKADRVLAEFDLGNTKLTVTEGSTYLRDQSFVTADTILHQLEDGPVLYDKLSALPHAKSVIDRWTQQGLLISDVIDGVSHLRLSDTALSVLAPAGMLSMNLSLESEALDQLPDTIKNSLEKMSVSELMTDDSVPFSVIVEFLHTLPQIDYEFVHTPPHVTMLFEVLTETRVYFAQSANRGLPGSGMRIELRILDHGSRPFDEQTRNDKISDIYQDSDIIDAVTIQNESQPDNFVSLKGHKPEQPVVPLTEEARDRDAVLENLYRFIGDAQTFPDRPKALVFDLDGTLRIRENGGFLPIDDDLLNTMRSFIEMGMNIVVVSGQGYPEIDEAFVSHFTPEERKRMFVYPSSGAEGFSFAEDGQPVELYSQPLKLVLKEKSSDHFLQELKDIADAYGITGYQTRVTDSQIAFRLLQSTNEQRHLIFDEFRKYVSQLGYQLKVDIAGRFSIDISMSDKAYAIRDFVHSRVPLDTDDILFFADSYHGNDEPMAEAMPDGLHFHVGTVLEDEQIPESVTSTDGKGPATTLSILQQLQDLIGLVVRDGVDERPAQKVMRNLAAYYDFHDQFSTITPVDEMEEKLMWPILFETKENQWEIPIEQLEEGDFSQTLIGVGVGGVGLSYIAAAQPEKAIFADTHPWITQYFIPLRSAMISLSRTRVEFISLLSGRPVKIETRDGKKYFQTDQQLTGQPAQEISEDATLEEIAAFFAQIPFYEKYSQNVVESMVRLFPKERQEYVRMFFKEFFNQFNLTHMLEALIKADQRAGKPSTWLSDETRYQRVKSFIEEGRLFATEANWATNDIPKISSMLEAHNDKVSILYLSNVHHKIPIKQQPDGSLPWLNFVSNIASLPRTENALILSDQTLSNDPFDSISQFNDSSYESKHLSYGKQYFNPDLLYPVDDNATSLLRINEFASLVEQILTDMGRDELAAFYHKSDLLMREAILDDYAQEIYRSWTNLRGRIRRNEPLTGDDSIMASELSAALGYGLKDIDAMVNRFSRPAEFFMAMLRLPYSPYGRLGVSRTLIDMQARLASTIDMYRSDPDVVLLDASFLTASANTQNFALSEVLNSFRNEHRNRHGRRVVFVGVDDTHSQIIPAKDDLDTSLYLRGDSSDMLDQIISAGFDPEYSPDRDLMDQIRAFISPEQLEDEARTQLENIGVTSPSQTQIDQQIDQLLQEKARYTKFRDQLIYLYGISPDTLSERISILTGRDSFLYNFADAVAATRRLVDIPQDAPVDEPMSEGVYLIDILRSIGDDNLPAHLQVVSVKSNIILTDEQHSFGFEQYVELFSSIYDVYQSIADTNPTYASFVKEINQAVEQGRIPASQATLLFTKLQLNTIFELQMNTSLNDQSVIPFFIQSVQEQFTTREKNELISLLARQIKLIRLTNVLQLKQTQQETVTIGDMMSDPAIANIDFTDVASYLEVQIPPRPIEKNLGDAIQRQRLLDTSA